MQTFTWSLQPTQRFNNLSLQPTRDIRTIISRFFPAKLERPSNALCLDE